MGRYYHGDIEGKFWQGIQDSNDARHFGGHETELQDEETGVVHELEYFFYMDDIQDINSGIATCIEDLGVYKEKLDELFDEDSYCNKEDLANKEGQKKDPNQLEKRAEDGAPEKEGDEAGFSIDVDIQDLLKFENLFKLS
jgi:hypothetical protein